MHLDFELPSCTSAIFRHNLFWHACDIASQSKSLCTWFCLYVSAEESITSDICRFTHKKPFHIPRGGVPQQLRPWL